MIKLMAQPPNWHDVHDVFRYYRNIGYVFSAVVVATAVGVASVAPSWDEVRGLHPLVLFFLVATGGLLTGAVMLAVKYQYKVFRGYMYFARSCWDSIENDKDSAKCKRKKANAEFGCADDTMKWVVTLLLLAVMSFVMYLIFRLVNG